MLAEGQNNLTSSPYSIFGLGDPFSINTTYGMSMGDTKYAHLQPAYLNPANPASYSGLRAVSFEVAGVMNRTYSFSENGDQTNDNGGLRYFGLGIPITNRIGIAIGAMPFTATGYRITSTTELEYPGNVQTVFRGDGGTSIVYGGLGYTIHQDSIQRFSVGANANLYIGNTETEALNVLDDNAGGLNAITFSKWRSTDFVFDLGLLYTRDVTGIIGKKNSAVRKNITLGANYAIPTKLKTEFTDMDGSFLFSNGLPRLIDTLYYNVDTNQIFLPQRFGIGMVFEFYNINTKRFLKLAFDYEQFNWSELLIRGESQNLNNSQQLSFGMEFIPDKEDFRKILSVMRYRVGARTKNTRINVNGYDIGEYGVTFGFGIPLIRSRSTFTDASTLDFGMDFAVRGTENNSLIREQITTINIGLSLAPSFWDRWFKRRKID